MGLFQKKEEPKSNEELQREIAKLKGDLMQSQTHNELLKKRAELTKKLRTSKSKLAQFAESPKVKEAVKSIDKFLFG